MAKKILTKNGRMLSLNGHALTVDVSETPSGAVLYTEQSLTDEQKSQARTNIGAGTSSFSGSYNDLTDKPTIPEGYTLPVASADVLGGIKPVAKTDAMTSAVGVDADGKLWSAAGGGTITPETITLTKLSQSRYTINHLTPPVCIKYGKLVVLNFSLTSPDPDNGSWTAVLSGLPAMFNKGEKIVPLTSRDGSGHLRCRVENGELKIAGASVITETKNAFDGCVIYISE